MKKHVTRMCLLVTVVMTMVMNTMALDEAEVESAIAASGKEVVSGNILIWLLCAIAFLKISQKIDSFLAALGINVGRTGGNMLAELMIAGRTLGAAVGSVGGAITGAFGHSHGSGHSSAAGQAFTDGSHSVAGIVQRAAGNATANSMTGHGGAIGNFIGGAMLGNSLSRSGKFATDVVGAVAKGNISTVGSITGEKASQALTSYLGYGSSTADALQAETAVSSQESGGDVVTINGGHTEAAGPMPGIGAESIPAEPPSFRDVEIGGGRITGFETPAGGGEERQFAMYNAGQYMQPSGEFETVQTADGEDWYKQYAQPTVERMPYKSGDRVKYTESIVSEMPQIPRRKDRV